MNTEDRHALVDRIAQEWAEASVRKLYIGIDKDGHVDMTDPRVVETIGKMKHNYYAFGIKLMLEAERIGNAPSPK